jgi:hypothetical protein
MVAIESMEQPVKLSKNPLVNVIVLLSAIGMILSIGMLWHASEKAVSFQEPRVFAYSDNQGAIFNIHDALFRVTDEGGFVEKSDLVSIGLDRIVADIQLSGGKLWVLEGKTHRIKSCPIPFAACQVVTEVKGVQGIEPMDLALTPDGKYIYVAISKKHRIDKFRADGTFVQTLALDQPLRFPNDIIALEAGHLIVADTNNHRIVLLQDDGTGQASVTAEIPMEGEAARNGNTWPTALALGSDRHLWVLNQDGFFEDGDVVGYPPLDIERPSQTQMVANAKIFSMAYSAEPSTLGSMGSGIMVVDRSDFSMLRIGIPAESANAFGDPTILSELSRVRQMRDMWRFRESLAQGGIALFVVLLLIAAMIEFFQTKDKKELFSQRETYEDAPAFTVDKIITPDAQGIVWLKPKASLIKKLYLALWTMGAALIAIWGLAYYSIGLEGELLYMLGVLTAMILGIALLALAAGKQRIGVKDGRIWLVDAMKRKTHAAARQVLYTGRRVIIGDVAVGIYDGKGNAVFDEAQFSQYVLPLLQESKNPGELELYVTKLKEGDPKAWLGVIAMGAIILVLVWLYMESGYLG